MGEDADPCPNGEYVIVVRGVVEAAGIYTHLLDPMRESGVRAAAHVTGGGWTNLERLGGHRYVIDDAFDPQPVFEFVQSLGDVADAEMHRTFNMGTGFVCALAPEDAAELTSGTDGRMIGRVESGTGVSIRGLEL